MRRFRGRTAIAVILLIGGIYLSLPWWLPVLATSLDVSDPLRPADAVLILPGSEEARPRLAADLIQAGYAKLAILPETSQNPAIPSAPLVASTQNNRELLLRRGIPAEQIVILEGASRSTLGDAESLARYFQRVPAIDVIVVTNAYHTRRAKWAFLHVLPEYQDRIRFYAVPDRFDSKLWWRSRGGRNDVLTEWVKYLCYLTIHGQGWIWCVVLAIACVTIVKAGRSANRCQAEETEHVGVRITNQPKRGT